MDSPIIFYTFNGIGLIICLSAIAAIVHALSNISEMVRKGLFSLMKGFILVVISFLWTLVFGRLLVPSQILNVQAIILSLGMAMMIYSANKLMEIYQHSRDQEQPHPKKDEKKTP